MKKNHLYKERGSALIILVLILLLAGTTVLFSLLDGTTVKLERNKKTAAALSEAKIALIGYALLNTNKPGTLPCTDNNNDGSSDVNGSNCSSYIGRLPWKQLGISMLRDGYQECLWYALSPIFRNPMSLGNRNTNPLNSDTNGTINIVNDNDVLLTGINPVIAVIFAPKSPLSGQNRSGLAMTYCPGDSIPTNYLDVKGAVNNAIGNVTGTTYTFKTGQPDSNFNDELIYITAKELYPLLRKRITKEILGDVDVASGLIDYYQTHAVYPCPTVKPGGLALSCSAGNIGYVPYADNIVDLQYATLGPWLKNNKWFDMATYQYVSATHIKVTITDAFGSYTCDANKEVINCT